jgi:hypothetical protein
MSKGIYFIQHYILYAANNTDTDNEECQGEEEEEEEFAYSPVEYSNNNSTDDEVKNEFV